MTIVDSVWSTCRIKLLATKIGSGKTPAGGAETYQSNGVIFLRSQNIHFDGLRLDDVAYIDEVVHREMRGTRVFPGDVLLNITGASLGRVTYFPEGLGEANVNQHVCIIRPNGNLDSRYLAYALSTHPSQGQILSMQVGGNRDGLNFEQVGSLEIPVPDIDVQRRIADFLDAETARIDTLTERKRKMRDLLVLRRERLIEEVLGLARQRNDLVPLNYVAQEITVGIVITPAKWYVNRDGVPALRGVNVRPGKVVRDDIVQISTEGHAEHRKSSLHAGDVVVVRTGQAGAAAVVPQDLDGANCIDLILIRPGEGIFARYLEYVLNSEYSRRHVAEYSVGSIQAHFNVGAMKKLPIPQISIEEQKRLTGELDRQARVIESLMSRLDDQLGILIERRQALITAAVTGQFDVTTARGTSIA
ncbi:restriction endonuclease subunit S [Streptomyces sp. URMC 129]|uniref:restriction endonuclease subunit S n=1 Tax=Streptomyces sp. URMC 129 TaxID=3423407 RepID=UPI003F1DB388